MRNLNGILIRGRSLKVSFAKYDKGGRPCNESAQKEAKNDSEVEWGASNHRETTEVGRSYKEVVMGVKHHKRIEVWEAKQPRRKESIGDERHDGIMNLKEMLLKVKEEIHKSVSMDKNKQNMGLMLIDMVIELLRKEDGPTSKEENEVKEVEQQLKGAEKSTKAFLEDELIQSM